MNDLGTSKVAIDEYRCVSQELLGNLGLTDVDVFLRYPKSGKFRNLEITFLESDITKLILKRPETKSFTIHAMVSDDPLQGEVICESHDNKALITLQDGVLNFGFDPIGLYLSNLNEGFTTLSSSLIRNIALRVYWLVPNRIRRLMRSQVRKRVATRIRRIEEIDLLGVANNVLVNLIQNHFEKNHSMKIRKPPATTILTHDIDTDLCQTSGMKSVVEVESKHHIISTWFFVPNSVQYKLNQTSLRFLDEMGHEIGMHGYRHDGLMPLNNPVELLSRLKKGRNIFTKAGINVSSFRSPWALRSPHLHQCLVRSGFNADSSYPDIDTLGTTGGLKGVSYNRPFRPFQMKTRIPLRVLPIWEIPITGPQDVQLIEDLGVTDDELLRVWKYKAEFCYDFDGVFVHHTHPVHICKHLDVYSKLLETIRNMGMRMLTMREFTTELNSRSESKQ